MANSGSSNPSNLQELATYLGTSVSTVSRTLSGQGNQYRIGKATQEKITNAAARFGVRPDPAGRSLRMKRTLTLGLLLPDITNPFFATIARSVERAAQEKGYVTILCDCDNSGMERRALDVMRERRVDAIIACPVSDDSAVYADLVKSALPLVFVDRYFPDLSAPSVVSTDFEAAKNVAAVLKSKGHSHIACLHGDPRTSTSLERTRGVKAGIGNMKCTSIGSEFSVADGYHSTRQLLEQSPRPTAIFSYGNVNALGALQALGQAGVRIPEDISLVSFDDQPYATVLATPLSAVVQDTGKMATEALRIAFEEISDPGKNKGLIVEVTTEFLDRGSVLTQPRNKKT